MKEPNNIPKKNKKGTIKVIIIAIFILVLMAGGYGYYKYIYIPNQVTDYLNEVIDLHNELGEISDEKEELDKKLEDEEDLDEAEKMIDKYINLTKDFEAKLKQIEDVDTYERNEDTLKDFNEEREALVKAGKEYNQMDKDYAQFNKDMFELVKKMYEIGDALGELDETDDYTKGIDALTKQQTEIETLVKDVKAVETDNKMFADCRDALVDELEVFNKFLKDLIVVAQKGQKGVEQQSVAILNEAQAEIESLNNQFETEFAAKDEIVQEKMNEVVEELEKLNKTFNKKLDALRAAHKVVIEHYDIPEE